MAGTGNNFENTCLSLMSYQQVINCEKANCPGKQWYCTEGLCGKKSGACGGDSGGPSWTFGKGLTGMTAASTVDQKTDICTNGISIFQDLSYYKKWIKKTIRNKLRTCDPGHDSRLLNNNGSSTPQPSQNSSIGVGKISE